MTRRELLASAALLPFAPPDPNLLSVAYRQTPLTDILTDLTERTGLRLQAPPREAARRLSLFARDVSLDALLDQIARVFDHGRETDRYRWETRDGTRRLVRPEQQDFHDRTERAEPGQQLVALLKSFRARLREPALEAAKHPWEAMLTEKELHWAAFRAAVSQMSEKDFYALVRGETVRFDARSLAPQAAQRDIPLRAQHERNRRFEIEVTGIDRGDYTPIQVTERGTVYAVRGVRSDYRPVRQDGFTVRLFGPSDLADLGIFGPLLDREHRPLAIPLEEKSVVLEPVPPAPDNLRADLAAMLQPPSRQKLVEILAALSEKTGKALCLEFYYRLTWIGPYPPIPVQQLTGTPTKIVNNLCAHYDLAAAATPTGWVLWPIDAALVRDNDIAEWKLTRWRKRVRQISPLPNEELSEIASAFTYEQIIATLDQALREELRDTPDEITAIPLRWLNQRHWYHQMRAVAQMPLPQRTIAAEAGIPWSALPESVRGELERGQVIGFGMLSPDRQAEEHERLQRSRIWYRPPGDGRKRPPPWSLVPVAE